MSTERPKRALMLRQTYKEVGSPVILVESIPPNISSPVTADVEVVGCRQTETKLFSIFFCLKRLSVTVEMTLVSLGLRVPFVKPLGPMLQKRVFEAMQNLRQRSTLTPKPRHRVETHWSPRQYLWTAYQ